MTTADRLFSLLRVSLGAEESICVLPDELPALFELANFHDLAHLVCSALKKTGDLPADMADERVKAAVAGFKKQQSLSVFRAENIGYEQKRLCAALEEAGIDFMPLKGAVLRALYPAAWMRTSCDIDVLVKEEDLSSAVDLLCEKLGGKAEERHSHDQSVFTESGVHIELHFLLDEYLPQADGVLSRVWEGAVPAEGKTHETCMDDGMFYVYHIAHMAKHVIHGGCGVRPFIDLFLMDKDPRFAPEKVDGLLKESGLLTFANEARHLSRVWFASETPTDLSRRMERYLLSAGVYGSSENNRAIENERQTAKYVKKRLFLPYEVLKKQYPKLEKHKWLMPWYQVRRWVTKLFNGRATQEYRKLKETGSTVTPLLKDLGL